MRKRSTAADFWSRVLKGDGCWEWQGYRDPNRYGRLSFAALGPGVLISSRVAWSLSFGPIPAGLDVLHRCDNPICCRPDHLFLGTAKDNARDMVAKDRDRHGSRHPRAKFSNSRVRNIKMMTAQGVPRTRIAGIFGVDISTISLIVRGKRWPKTGVLDSDVLAWY